jgi:hypothetical protein
LLSVSAPVDVEAEIAGLPVCAKRWFIAATYALWAD